MGGFSWVHWLVVLVVVVLVFGTSKLKNVGHDLGSAVRGFKEGLKGDDDKQAAAADKAPDASGRVIDHDEQKS